MSPTGRRIRVAFLCAAVAAATALGCTREGARPAPPARPTASSPSSASAETTAPGSSTPATGVEAPVERKVPPVLVTRVPSAGRMVALTFDLCETPESPTGFDEPVVQVLRERHVPATFFMGGHWAEGHANAARELGAVSFFEIGNHSYAHPHPTRVSLGAFRGDLRRAQDAVAGTTGRTPTLYRFPYGEHDAATLRLVASEGLVPIQWDVASGDPDPDFTAADIVSEVKRLVRPGSIVIMHANGRGRRTAEALPAVLDLLRKLGLRPVTVSELLDSAE